MEYPKEINQGRVFKICMNDEIYWLVNIKNIFGWGKNMKDMVFHYRVKAVFNFFTINGAQLQQPERNGVSVWYVEL